MGEWLHHWVYMDFWAPVWPNIAAGVIMSTWIIQRVRKHFKRHHEPLHARLERIEKLLRGDDGV